MAGGQGHFSDFRDIPGGYYDSPAVRVVLNAVNSFGDLIYSLTICSRPTAPLVAVDRAQITFCISPFIPDAYPVLLQIGDIGIPFQKPKQFMNNGLDMDLFRCHQGEAFTQVKPHLIPERTDRAGTGTIILSNTLIEYVA